VRILLFGPPGVGKSTQADLIANNLRFKKFSMGDILRDEVASNSELGKKIKRYVESGELVPDDIVFELVKKFVCDNQKADILFEGYPRTVRQAEALDALLSQLGSSMDVVLEIYIGDDEVFRRLSNRGYCPNCSSIYNYDTHPPKDDSICDNCGQKLVTRSDDSEEVIRRRLRLYAEQTKKLADHYNIPDVYKRIRADGTKQEVFDKIAHIIHAYSNKE
jgi:adenylate kinase